MDKGSDRMTARQKARIPIRRLERILRSLQRIVVAYSGGVDSTFLLAAALKFLGPENVIAVTADSETYPRAEKESAREIANDLKARHIIIHTSELGIRNFKRNPIERCYYCKKELFGKLQKISRRFRMRAVVDGTNADDHKDLRFGVRAAKELGVRSPLAEAGIGKNLIRYESRKMRLRTWKKPSFACLASRFPYGEKISAVKLKKVDRAEEFLRSLGFGQVRVRLHGETVARIELSRQELSRALKHRAAIIKKFKKLGLTYIALDLEGYRTGSLNIPYLYSGFKRGTALLTKA